MSTSRLKADEKEAYVRVHQMLLDALSISGITRTELARRVGVTPGAVSIVLSKPHNMRIRTFVWYLHAMGMSVNIDLPKQKKGKKR
jgi:transcriptional regulator with XRE-family HTH domain